MNKISCNFDFFCTTEGDITRVGEVSLLITAYKGLRKPLGFTVLSRVLQGNKLFTQKTRQNFFCVVKNKNMF